MKRGLLLFLGTVLFLLVGQEVSSSTDFPWQKIDEGFEFKSLQVEGDPYRSLITLKILRISLDKFKVAVLDARAFGEIKLDIKELARKAQALAAINGGFFLPGYKPLGLLIVDGKEVNPLRRADWGIFLIQDNIPRIIHTTILGG